MEEIEIIAVNLKSGCVTKKIMSSDTWVSFHKNNRKKGFQYIPYKKGFSQFNLAEEKKIDKNAFN